VGLQHSGWQSSAQPQPLSQPPRFSKSASTDAVSPDSIITALNILSHFIVRLLSRDIVPSTFRGSELQFGVEPISAVRLLSPSTCREIGPSNGPRCYSDAVESKSQEKKQPSLFDGPVSKTSD
jgi:hypothetical protein